MLTIAAMRQVVSRVWTSQTYRGVLPFIAIQLPGLALIVAFRSR